MLGCAGLLVLGMVALTILGAALGLQVSQSSSGIETSYPTPTPVRSSASASATPTPKPTPKPTTRAHPSATAFTNDGWRVPSPPASPLRWLYPTSRAEAVAWTKTNALYEQAMGTPVRCPYDPVVRQPNVPRAQLEEGVNAYVDCLMGAWRIPVQATGYQLSRPAVAFFEEEVTTPCGRARRGEVAGYYCSANAVFYIPYGQYVVRNGDGLPTYALEVVIAHEFGHHVQARVGIFGGQSWLRENVGDPTLEIQRRMELQAQCFAGLGLSTTAYSQGLTSADRNALVAGESRRGDEPGGQRTHGTPANSGKWFGAGLGSGHVGACRTFTASPEYVE